MFEANTDLRLFGYDLRSAGSFLRAGVAQLFWDNDSPIRQQLDEPVRATRVGPDREVVQPGFWYRGSKQLAGDIPSQSPFNAIVLPDDMVLHRTLALPGALSSSIREAVHMEVKAFSPFPEDDTVFGWRVTASDAERVAIDVAIASRAAATHVLREVAEKGSHVREEGSATVAVDHTGLEVWSFTPDSEHPVVILGFGESYRNAQYRRYLAKFLAAVGAALLALALAPLLSGLVLSLRANSLDAQVLSLRSSTADEMAMREELSVVRLLGDRIASEVEGSANFRRELSVLSAKVPDDA
ncbi:hypothetical protein, partial [Congregibacter sp.]|uniref:hypothetical protein n=1 Tax=Congregibacter sp. TaxID=2744308 RepID=UPI003F6B44F7